MWKVLEGWGYDGMKEGGPEGGKRVKRGRVLGVGKRSRWEPCQGQEELAEDLWRRRGRRSDYV